MGCAHICMTRMIQSCNISLFNSHSLLADNLLIVIIRCLHRVLMTSYNDDIGRIACIPSHHVCRMQHIWPAIYTSCCISKCCSFHVISSTWYISVRSGKVCTRLLQGFTKGSSCANPVCTCVLVIESLFPLSFPLFYEFRLQWTTIVISFLPHVLSIAILYNTNLCIAIHVI